MISNKLVEFVVKFFRQTWQRTRCAHEWAWMRNVYGDEINHADGRRSVWCCKKCRGWQYRSDLQ